MSFRLLASSGRCFRLPHTLFSLFWSLFGLIQVNSVEILYPYKKEEDHYKNTFPFGMLSACFIFHDFATAMSIEHLSSTHPIWSHSTKTRC